MSLDFSGLNARLLADAETFVPRWLPGGKREGREWRCASLRGGRGHSFGVNLTTGRWAEFAGGDTGGDLVSLYAAVRGLDQGEAYRDLAAHVDYRAVDDYVAPLPPAPETGAPPAGAPLPACVHTRLGLPSQTWLYRDSVGAALMAVARYDLPDGKQVLPWTWHLAENRWVPRGWPGPRPLYGLETLGAPGQVLLVEGEKCADAARTLVEGRMLPLTWQGGAGAWRRSDWSPLAGRSVVLWPDADDAGRAAMEGIGALLVGLGCAVKRLDVSEQPKGWDCADAVAEGWDCAQMLAWAKERVSVVEAESVAEPAAVAVVDAESVAEFAAVSVVLQSAPVPTASLSVFDRWNRLGLAYFKNGTPHTNADNGYRALAGTPEFRDLVWYDSFYCRLRCGYDLATRTACEPRGWTDADEIQVLLWLQREIGLPAMNQTAVTQAVSLYACAHVRNSARDWLNGLHWDNKSRLDSLFPEYFKTANTDYTRQAGANFMKAMVARVLKPGCKVDSMPILVGKQGIGKSRGLRALGGQWYGEAPGMATVDQKDFYLSLRGKMLMEIAELDGFHRSNAEAVKRMLSCAVDIIRDPFGHLPKDVPRTVVFVGSTNHTSFLEDPTGARRFWPVLCGEKVEVTALECDRDQLFAEAVQRVKGGATWHEIPDVEAREAQEAARLVDVWQPRIESWAHGKAFITTEDAGLHGLELSIKDLTPLTQRRIAACLRALGWQEARQRIKSVQMRGWIRPAVPLSNNVGTDGGAPKHLVE